MPRRAARFCPYCASPLAPADDHGTLRPTCVPCSFVAYQNPAPAAGVILAEDGRLVLVRRRWEPKAGLWCLPSGFMEYHETPEETAIREAREETGLEVAIESLHGAYRGGDDPRTRVVLLVYRARVVGGRLRAGDDARAVRRFALDELPELAFRSHRRALRDLRRALRLERSLQRPPRPRV
jgi:8-oxo-dGTP diphosphatase